MSVFNIKNAASFCRYGVVPAIVLFLYACSSRQYTVRETENPVFRENTAFVNHEDISDARFDSLKTKYRLDTVVGSEKDEFKRVLLLRNWIRSKVSINDFGDPYPGADHPQGIIDAAMNGQGFHCGHYMVVQNAVMNAYGYVTRCLGSGPGVKDSADGHHGINEIWLNSYNKWFLSDAKFNHHFEKDGVPLSALEVREAFLKNKGADLVLVKGPERTPITLDSLKDRSGRYVKRDKAGFARTYTWIEWEKSNNRFTAWPDFRSPINVYEDAYFKKNVWYWDGKPHWAYNTEHMVMVNDRAAIEWTPNTIRSNVSVENDHATIHLTSTTPGFREYQAKNGDAAQWESCDSVIRVNLDRDKHDLAFRAVNAAGVAGPEHKIVISR